jgi:hypothetical protein
LAERNEEQAARRVGRVIGIVVFAAIVTAFTAVCSVEIIMQAWAATDAPSPSASPHPNGPNGATH